MHTKKNHTAPDGKSRRISTPHRFPSAPHINDSYLHGQKRKKRKPNQSKVCTYLREVPHPREAQRRPRYPTHGVAAPRQLRLFRRREPQGVAGGDRDELLLKQQPRRQWARANRRLPTRRKRRHRFVIERGKKNAKEKKKKKKKSCDFSRNFNLISRAWRLHTHTRTRAHRTSGM
jgi:hypothetical protein